MGGITLTPCMIAVFKVKRFPGCAGEVVAGHFVQQENGIMYSKC